jgi:hypothetical protein
MLHIILFGKVEVHLYVFDLFQILVDLLFWFFDVYENLFAHQAFGWKLILWLFLQGYQHCIGRVLNVGNNGSRLEIIHVLDLLLLEGDWEKVGVNVSLFHHRFS